MTLLHILLSLCLVSGYISYGSGLKCWHCVNARSEEDCISNGQSEQCRGQAMSCQTEIRYHGGTGSAPFITKRCKQTNACQSNQGQNPGAAAGPTQCNKRVENSVCRCCCKGFHCNRRDFWCSGRTRGGGPGPAARKCKVLTAPENGSKQCRFRKAEGDIGTRCTFTCDAGYHLNGDAVSVCKRGTRGAKPQFDKAPPDCEELPETVTAGDNPITLFDCNDAPPEPRNGGRSCMRNGDNVVCMYFCGEEESIVGDGRVTCNRNTGWNGTTPECNTLCPRLSSTITNGRRICGESVEIGATCKYLCDNGFEMIGSSTTTCTRRGRKAIWSPRAPRCTSSALVP